MADASQKQEVVLSEEEALAPTTCSEAWLDLIFNACGGSTRLVSEITTVNGHGGVVEVIRGSVTELRADLRALKKDFESGGHDALVRRKEILERLPDNKKYRNQMALLVIFKDNSAISIKALRPVKCSGPDCTKTIDDAKLKACAGCECVRYCSPECQLADWKPRHKEHCTRLAELTKDVKKRGWTSKSPPDIYTMMLNYPM